MTPDVGLLTELGLMSRTLRPSPGAEAAVLAVVQRAQERLPSRDAPLVERLFALECAARGGRAVAPAVERYRGALREAERWLDDTWEPDVPHVSVVGQALSASDALGQDPPSTWAELLTTTLDELGNRQAKYGLGGDPGLLAAALRGLAAAGATPPEWMLTAATDVLETHTSVTATAELADALARHPAGEPLVRTAFSAAFAGGNGTDGDAAYARWWLAGRGADAERQLNVRIVEDAQLQALAAASPLDGKAAAMVMEAAARAVGDLVIASVDTLSSARSRHERQVLVSRALYRGVLFAVVLIIALVNLHSIAHAFSPAAKNEHAFRQALAGAFVAGLGLCVSGTANAVARSFGRKPPEWARYAELLAILLAGIIAAVIT
jgi:hypothetical protein